MNKGIEPLYSNMQKINNSDLVHIREVYEIAQRLEDKIDTVDKKVSNIEGKASIVAVFWSSIIGIGGIILGRTLK